MHGKTHVSPWPAQYMSGQCIHPWMRIDRNRPSCTTRCCRKALNIEARLGLGLGLEPPKQVCHIKERIFRHVHVSYIYKPIRRLSRLHLFIIWVRIAQHPGRINEQPVHRWGSIILGRVSCNFYFLFLSSMLCSAVRAHYILTVQLPWSS